MFQKPRGLWPSGGFFHAAGGQEDGPGAGFQGILVGAEWEIHESLPSGKLLHNYGKVHHFEWVNPLFLWQFSIAMLVYHDLPYIFWFDIDIDLENHDFFFSRNGLSSELWSI